MSAYLGTVGAMVPIKCASDLRWQAERPASTETTLGGRRIAYVGPRAHREWSVSLNVATPSALGPIENFVHGYYGRGPFWWVSEWAAKTNLLPPRIAAQERLWRNTTRGGAFILPDGTYVPDSLIASGSTAIDEPQGTAARFPVVPGVPVTGSAWLGGNIQNIAVQIRDESDTVLVGEVGNKTGTALQRVSVTVTPPSGAHHCVVRFNNPGRIAAPALTYTAQVTEWGPGAGADAVIVTANSVDALMATTHQSYASPSYTIQEVGP